MGVTIDGLYNGYGVAGTTSQTKQSKELGREAFLQLLVTELSNQDPLKPMDDKEFIAELAQFSSLEQMQTLNQNLQAFASSQSVVGAASLVGRTVTATNPSDGSEVSGKIESVRLDSNEVSIVVNGVSLPATSVTSIS